MLTSDDFKQMRDGLAEVHGDHEMSIVIRRGAATLPAQKVRVTRSGGGRTVQGEAGQEAQIGALAFGGPDLDIQPGDRFTNAGLLYEVITLRPNRVVSTVAELKVVS